MAKNMHWALFWDEFSKLPKVNLITVNQKGLFCGGLIFAYKANEMNANEVIDTMIFSPSSRHYKDRPTEYFNNWIYQVFKHRDNYEFVAAAVVQAARCDLSHERNFEKCLLNKIAIDSKKIYGDIVWLPRHENSRYFHAVEDDWYAEQNFYTEENGYDKHYPLGHPIFLTDYKDIAAYIYNLMRNIFTYYQFVIVDQIENKDDFDKVLTWTYQCRNYRSISHKIKDDEHLTELSPCSSISFDETVKVCCDKHGEYTLRISAGHYPDYRCPECLKEEAAKKKAEFEQISQENKHIKRNKDIANFIALASQKFDNFYDYSLVAEDYQDLDNTKVRIIHPEYGIFEMLPSHHLRSLTGYCKSNVKSKPTIKEIKYVLDGDGNKLYVGDKVKWQKSGKSKWYHGTVTELNNFFVTAVDANSGVKISKEHTFIFAE